MLPINAFKSAIIDAIRNNAVTIVAAETGSGKSTQIPQFLLDAGMGKIVVTQPRRLAAQSLAGYVAGQRNSVVGQEVGFRVRLDHRSTTSTQLEFVTTGILLREFHRDPLLRKFSVVVVDEVHERSLETDFILGLLHRVLARRSDLKVVIMSATLEAEKLQNFFGDQTAYLEIPGRVYPVQTHYLSSQAIAELKQEAEQANVSEAVWLAARRVGAILNSGEPGDILVFMSGKQEIFDVIQLMEMRQFDVVAVPAFGQMTMEQQMQVFAPVKGRKVVVATNIAETSITIPGIVHVVDSGLIRQVEYDPSTGISHLLPIRHSLAGLTQRKGRAGREQAGHYYPLYSEDDLDFREVSTRPEILRQNLSGVVLQMLAMGVVSTIPEVKAFKLLDSPDSSLIIRAFQELVSLKAVGEQGLTELGRKMSTLPLDPPLACSLLTAADRGCVAEVLTIAAWNSLQHPPVLRLDVYKDSDAVRLQARQELEDSRGDAWTALNMMRLFERKGRSFDWAYHHGLSGPRLLEACNIRQQLEQIVVDQGIALSSIGYRRQSEFSHRQDELSSTDESLILAFLAGHPSNLLFKSEYGGWGATYQRVFNLDKFGYREDIWLDGSSQLKHESCTLVVCAEIRGGVSKKGNQVYFANHCLPVTVELVRQLWPNMVEEVEESSELFDTVYTYRVIRIAGQQIERELISKKAKSWRHDRGWGNEIVTYLESRGSSYHQVLRLQGQVSNLIIAQERYSFGGEGTASELSGFASQLALWSSWSDDQLAEVDLGLIEGRLMELATAENLARAEYELERREQARSKAVQNRQRASRLLSRVTELRNQTDWVGSLSSAQVRELDSIERQLVNETDEEWSELDVWEASGQSLNRLEVQLAAREARLAEWKAEQEDLEFQQLLAEEYRDRVAAHKGWPDFGHYSFRVGPDGQPVDYRDSNFDTCRYDGSVSEVAQLEDGKLYWGFLNQRIEERGKTIKMIGILFEVEDYLEQAC